MSISSLYLLRVEGSSEPGRVFTLFLSSGQFCPQEEQNIFKIRSRKEYGFHEIVEQSRPLQPWCVRIKLYFIFAGTFFFIMQQVLFVSKKIFKFAATFKIAAAVIKNCSSSYQKLQQKLSKIAACPLWAPVGCHPCHYGADLSTGILTWNIFVSFRQSFQVVNLRLG